MGAFSVWLLQSALSLGEKAAIDALFSKGLSKRIIARIEEWRKKLPEGESLIDSVALFAPELKHGIDDLRRKPSKIAALLKSGQIPSVENWQDAFLEQWEWVVAHIVEPQPFFNISRECAESHLHSLANYVFEECAKDKDRFQIEMLKRMDSLDTKVDLLAEKFDKQFGQQSIPSGVPAQIDSTTDSETPFAEEINAAVQLTKDLNPDAAIKKLNTLKAEQEDSMTPHEKYRIEANLGIAFQAKEEHDTAAQHFINCRQYKPDDEDARCYEAAGYFSLGDVDKTQELVLEILIKFPNSDFALAMRVRSAAKDFTFDEIIQLIPEGHEYGPELAMALSRKARECRISSKAVEFAKLAAKGAENDTLANSHLGSVLIDAAFQEIAPLLAEKPQLSETNKATVDEAMRYLNNALEKYSTLNTSHSISICKYYLSRGHFLLGEQKRADVLLQEAYALQPDEVEFAIQHAVSLYEQSHLDEAIDILRKVADLDETLGAAILLSQILQERDKPNVPDEVISILEEKLETFPGNRASANTEFLDELCNLYHKKNRWSDAQEVLEKYTSEFGPLEKLVLHCAVHRRSGDLESAKMSISDAIKLLDSNTHHWHRHLMVRELICLEMYREAFEILRQHVPDSCVSLDTGGLLLCAEKCGEDLFLMEFCASLRKSGILSSGYLDIECGLLERYHAGEKSIEVSTEVLAATNDEQLAQEMRVRLSFLGILYNRNELIETDLTLLPSANKTEPYLGFLVAQLLGHQKRHDEAQTYSYTLLRSNSNFDSSWAHKALILSYLFDRKNEPIVRPVEVAVGTAVQYRDETTKNIKWLIVEDEPDPDISRYEYEPDHHLCKELLGKQIGDEFDIRKGSIQDKKGTVISLEDKGVYRFNICLQEWEDRFDEFFMQAISMKRDETGELDLTPLIKAAEAREAEIERQNEVYRTHPLSLASFAHLLQKDILEAVAHLADSDLPIRCCYGNQEEGKTASSLLAQPATIVLGPTAIATLFHSEFYKYLKCLPHNLIVTRGTLIRLQSALDDALRFANDGVLSAKNSSVIIQEISAEQQIRWSDNLRALIQSLKSHTTIVDGLPLASMRTNKREQLVELFGWEVVESIAVADAANAILWSDDMFVSHLALSECNVRRVWTELVFTQAGEKGHINVDDFYALQSTLIRLGYRHCRLGPPFAVRMAQDSNWNFQNEPFASVINWLSIPDIKPEGVIDIAEELLPRVYQGNNEVVSNATVLRILSCIGSRPNGRALIKELRRRVGIFCRCDFFTENRLTQDIKVWLGTDTQI